MVAEPPGWFLGFTAVCLLVSLPVGLISPIITPGLWLAAIFSLCAMITNIWDNKSRDDNGNAKKGLQCKGCGHVNRVYPWTL